MRPVLWSDLIAAARVVAASPPSARMTAAQTVLAQAHEADLYRLSEGRAHPKWGNGTLLAAASAHGAFEGPSVLDLATLRAVSVLATCMADHRTGRGSD